MYTTEIVNKRIDRANNQFVLKVLFGKNGDNFERDFRFGMDMSYAEVERDIKRYTTKLEEAETKVAAIAVGSLDLSGVTEVVATANEVARNSWFTQYGKLEQLEKLGSKAILSGVKGTKLTEKITEVKTSLNTGFKAEYLDDI